MDLQAEYTSTLMHWRHWSHVLIPGGTENNYDKQTIAARQFTLLCSHTFKDFALIS